MTFMSRCSYFLASSGASSSTVRFRPLGVVSNGITLPVFILCANAQSGQKQTDCPCFVIGFTSIEGRSHVCLSRLLLQVLAASTRPSSRDDWPVPPFCMPQVSSPNVLCLHFLSDLTSSTCPTDSMLRLVSLSCIQLLFKISDQFKNNPSTCPELHLCSNFCTNFVRIRQIVLYPIPVVKQIVVTTRQLVLNLFCRSEFSFRPGRLALFLLGLTTRTRLFQPTLNATSLCGTRLALNRLRWKQLLCCLFPYWVIFFVGIATVRPPCRVVPVLCVLPIWASPFCVTVAGLLSDVPLPLPVSGCLGCLFQTTRWIGCGCAQLSSGRLSPCAH